MKTTKDKIFIHFDGYSKQYDLVIDINDKSRIGNFKTHKSRSRYGGKVIKLPFLRKDDLIKFH